MGFGCKMIAWTLLFIICYKKKIIIIIIFAESFTLENFIFRIFSSSRGNGIIYFFRFAYVLYRFYKISKKSKDFISISNYIMWINFLYFRRAISVSHSSSNFPTVSTIFTNYPIA